MTTSAAVLDFCEGEGIAFIPWYPLGTSKVTHLEDNVAAAAVELTADDFDRLGQVGREEWKSRTKR